MYKPSLARILLITEPPGMLDVTGPDSVSDNLVGIVHEEGELGAVLTGDVSGPLRFAGVVDDGNELGCDAFPENVFDGAVALIERGDCYFIDKVDNAADAGAIAVIVYNYDDSGLHSMGATPADATIPAVLVTNYHGQALVQWCEDHPDDATVVIHKGRKQNL